MKHIRFTPDLLADLVSAAEGKTKHTERLDAFAKVLGYPTQTALMHSLKGRRAPAASLDEMLEADFAHYVRNQATQYGGLLSEKKWKDSTEPKFAEKLSYAAWKAKTVEDWTLSFHGIESALREYAAVPTTKRGEVRLADRLRFPFSRVCLLHYIVSNRSYVLTNRMCDDALNGVYPDAAERTRRVNEVKAEVRAAWARLPASAQRKPWITRTTLGAVARSQKVAGTSAEKVRDAARALGYADLTDMRDSIALLGQVSALHADDGPAPDSPFMDDLWAAHAAFQDIPSGSVDGRTRLFLKVVSEAFRQMKRHISFEQMFTPEDEDWIARFKRKGLGTLIILLRGVRTPASDVIADRLSVWPHEHTPENVSYPREVLLRASHHAAGTPLDWEVMQRFQKAHETAAGIWTQDDRIFVKELSLFQGKFEEYLALLSLDPDPVVGFESTGWVLRAPAASTRTAHTLGILTAARKVIGIRSEDRGLLDLAVKTVTSGTAASLRDVPYGEGEAEADVALDGPSDYGLLAGRKVKQALRRAGGVMAG